VVGLTRQMCKHLFKTLEYTILEDAGISQQIATLPLYAEFATPQKEFDAMAVDAN
jgi:hypothetical protein